jgi:hypothetical protein
MTRILALAWPELRVPEADPAPFERMLDALDDLSPRIEAVDVGVALVEITGLGPMWGPERRIAARAVMLARAVAPLRVRCGIGENRWLATLAARLARFERPDAPAALRILEREELGGLSLDLLPADDTARARFARFGLITMGQLADLPRSAVGAQFGPAGERLQTLARGHDPRPIVPRRRPERVERRATFEPALDGIGSVGLALRRLATELCDALRARHLAPGRAVLTIRLEDAPSLRVGQSFPQPALEPDWIARLLLSRLEAAARARMLSGANLGNLRQRDHLRSPAQRLQNMGKSVSSVSSPRSTDVDSLHKVAAIGTWQEPTADGRGPSPQVAVIGTWQAPIDETHEPRIVSVHLAFDRLTDPATRQLPAFEARAARWEELRWSLERIRHRFGEGRLWRAVADRPTAMLSEHRSHLAEINE